MKLTLTVFGYEVATIDLDIPEQQSEVAMVDRGVKKMSRLWVRSMTSG